MTSGSEDFVRKNVKGLSFVLSNLMEDIIFKTDGKIILIISSVSQTEISQFLKSIERKVKVLHRNLLLRIGSSPVSAPRIRNKKKSEETEVKESIHNQIV